MTAFGAMRMIVTVGWAIYPLGYVFGYLTGGVDANSLNVIYNLADFINKIAFGLIIWSALLLNSSRANSIISLKLFNRAGMFCILALFFCAYINLMAKIIHMNITVKIMTIDVTNGLSVMEGASSK